MHEQVDKVNISIAENDVEMEVAAFNKLLLAIYNARFVLGRANELIHMAKLADYYCALPALSRSLNEALLLNPVRIDLDKEYLIEVAIKLQHAELFRECVIYLAGSIIEPKLSKSGKQVQKVVINARNRIAAKIAEVHLGKCNTGFPKDHNN